MFEFFTTILEKIAAVIVSLVILIGTTGITEEKESHLLIKYASKTELPNKTLDDSLPKVSTSTKEKIKDPKTLLEESKKITPAKNTNAMLPPVSPVPPPTPSPTPAPKLLLSTSFLNEHVRPSVVNIYCTVKGSGVNSSSASGVIIDPRGIILTSAHVGQNLLLKDYKIKNFITCVARTGSPATPMYNLELVYIPPSWVYNNAEGLKDITHSGTGEEDYALLRITSKIDNAPLPATFPYLEPNLSKQSLANDESVFVASYPAGFLEGASVARDLWLSTGIANVLKLYTFSDTPGTFIDLFGISGTIGAQEGSSGGAVADFIDGKLLGIIATRTQGKTTSERELRILSIPYISKNLEAKTGLPMEDFLKGDMALKAKTFNETQAPELSKLLFTVLDR